MKKSALVLVLVLVGCKHTQKVADSPPAAAQQEAVPTLQLPADTHALREKLELTIDPDADGFSGTADIDVKLDAARDSIWLHARELEMGPILVTEGVLPPTAARWEQKDPEGVGRIVLPKPMFGAVHINIAFRGKWASGAHGLYRSEQKGLHYALTQFEAIDARRAFPCFDEPSAKIPWQVALNVPKALVAVTNGAETSRQERGNLVHIEFAPTPPLPSYLVAFAVGPFDVAVAAPVPANAARQKPLPLRILVPKGRAPELKYALAHSGEIVSTLEAYFGIAYPYDKLDFIAGPDMGGAMENAGAITYAESLLLFDEKTSTINQRRRFASVVAHELAHQWFGDLVTMAWWNDIWLNESFATWMGNKTIDAWNPQSEGELELTFGMVRAMTADSRIAARAVRQEIRSNDDIANAFDGITYQKGGAVLRMFERFVGVEKFQKGVHDYLEAHRFGNATVGDFTKAISAVAGRDVDPAFRTYLDAPGVPQLEVHAVCDKGAPHLHVKQSRYSTQEPAPQSNQLWKVPFCARFEDKGKSHDACALVETAETDVPLETCPTWLLPNAHGVGYYRMALTAADFATLRGKPFARLETGERVAYLLALSAAEQHGTLPFGELVNSAQPLLGDAHVAIASAAFSYLNDARAWLVGTPLQAKVERKIRDWLHPLAVELGNAPKANEDVDRAEKRAAVLTELYEQGHDDALRDAFAKKGAAFVAGGKIHREAVSPELVGIALRAYAERGGEPAWTALATLLANEQDSALRSRIIGALARVTTPALVDKARALTFDPGLRRPEVLSPLLTQVDRPELRDATWEWAKAHYDEIVKRMGGEQFAGLRVLALGSRFCDEAHVADVEKFFTPKLGKLPGAPRALAESLEAGRTCAARRAREEKEMRAYFQ